MNLYYNPSIGNYALRLWLSYVSYVWIFEISHAQALYMGKLNSDQIVSVQDGRSNCQLNLLPFGFICCHTSQLHCHLLYGLDAVIFICDTQETVCWLLNVPATCECISGTDLLRQFYVLPL